MSTTRVSAKQYDWCIMPHAFPTTSCVPQQQCFGNNLLQQPGFLCMANDVVVIYFPTV